MVFNKHINTPRINHVISQRSRHKIHNFLHLTSNESVMICILICCSSWPLKLSNREVTLLPIDGCLKALCTKSTSHTAKTVRLSTHSFEEHTQTQTHTLSVSSPPYVLPADENPRTHRMVKPEVIKKRSTVIAARPPIF